MFSYHRTVKNDQKNQGYKTCKTDSWFIKFERIFYENPLPWKILCPAVFTESVHFCLSRRFSWFLLGRNFFPLFCTNRLVCSLSQVTGAHRPPLKVVYELDFFVSMRNECHHEIQRTRIDMIACLFHCFWKIDIFDFTCATEKSGKLFMTSR